MPKTLTPIQAADYQRQAAAMKQNYERRKYLATRPDCPCRSKEIGRAESGSRIILWLEPIGDTGAKVTADIIYPNYRGFRAPEYGLDQTFDSVSEAIAYWESQTWFDYRTDLE